MDLDARIDQLVAPLRDDILSGASTLSRTAADVLRRAAIRVQAGSLEELRWALGAVGTKVLDAQPAMAPLVTLVARVIEAVEEAESLEEGRHAAAKAADAFRAGADARLAAVVAFGSIRAGRYSTPGFATRLPAVLCLALIGLLAATRV